MAAPGFLSPPPSFSPPRRDGPPPRRRNHPSRRDRAAAPERKASPPPFAIEIKDGKGSLRAADADFEELVRALAAKAGLRLSIYETDLHHRVTIDCRDIPLEDCFKKIAPNHGFLYRKGTGGEPALEAVAVFKSRAPGGAAFTRVARLPYGSGPGRIGFVNAAEVERQGPQSFAVDDEGNFYICDTVNSRLAVVSPAGKVIGKFPVRGLAADVAVAGETIFVLDEASGRLGFYRRDGTAGESIPVPMDRNGDGTTDYMLWRPALGAWLQYGAASFRWGIAIDRPFAGDMNADGNADAVIWRNSVARWFVYYNAGSQARTFYGAAGDTPVIGAGYWKAGKLESGRQK